MAKMVLLLVLVVVTVFLPTVQSQPRPPISLSFSIREELDVGTFVGNLKENARLDQNYPPDILSILQFKYLTEPALRYNLELTTGALMTGERIDREQICPMMEYCEDTFDVHIHPVSYFQIIKVRVIIEDINDNWPTFSNSRTSHQMMESAAIGSRIPVPSAIDPDSPLYGIQNYTWEDPSEKFNLEILPKLDGSTDLKIFLAKELNREWEDEYKIIVYAFDGGGLSGTTEIFITVLDANDNNPLFMNSTYEVTIDENIELERTILRVQAMDEDIGENGEIVYDFSPRTQHNYGHLFEIDSYTGDIRVIGEIDYETHEVFHLSVIAEDQGPGSLPADTTVVVNVRDINDNAPEIVINTLSEPSGNDIEPSGDTITTAEVMENSDMGTFVAHVTVSDSDKGDNGNFECVLNNNHFRLDNLYGTEYAVVSTKSLDRESRAHYELRIQCEDFGIPMQKSERKLRVNVGDQNDHAPMFEKHKYATSLYENNYENIYILTVLATDEDTGTNADIYYVLPPEVTHLFRLDQDQGILSAKVPLNREDWLNQDSQIRFKIMAFDKGEPQQHGETRVVITILDVNDEAPKFTEENYSFGIYENEPPNTSVGQVSAVDLDGPPYNEFQLRFAAENENDISDLFRMDRTTGDVYSLMTFDTEERGMYHLTVIATDNEDPLKIGRANITVLIVDINDNYPEFTFPSKTNRSVQVPAMLDKYSIITRVDARDLDRGENARIIYSISGGNSEDLFSIHSVTGVISCKRALSSATKEVYVLDVTASDHGDPRKRVMETLKLHINHSITVPLRPGKATGSDVTNFLSGHNLLIVIALAAASALIAVILIIAIIVIHRRSQGPKDEGRYNCRQEEAKKILATGPHTMNGSGNANGKPGMMVAPMTDLALTNGGPVHAGTLPREAPRSNTYVTPTALPQPAHSLDHIPPPYDCNTLPSHTNTGSPSNTMPHAPNHHPPKQWVATSRGLEAHHHLLGTLKREGDQDSCGGSCQDSGKGASEDEYGTPVHISNGNRKVSTDHPMSNRPNPSHPSSSSYNKRKPDFRTFSPVNTSPQDMDVRVGLRSPSIDAKTADVTRDRSPRANNKHYSHTLNKPPKGKHKMNSLSREDHNVSSYTPGYKVDPDDHELTYKVNEFIASDAREDAV